LLIEDSSVVVIENCDISGNTAVDGGGIATYETFLTIRNTTISNNQASEAGGGMSIRMTHALVEYSAIYGNDGGGYGGGVFTMNNYGTRYYFIRFNRTTIHNNHAGTYGGAIYAFLNQEITVTNCTIVNNTVNYLAGGIYFRNDVTVRVINTILFYNDSYEIQVGGTCQLLISNSDIQGGQTNGIYFGSGSELLYYGDNIPSAPMFVDTTENNFQLMENSPCIDAGTTFFAWEGDTIIDLPASEYEGTAPDIGAFESPYTLLVNSGPVAPIRYRLFQNYPNPFNSATTIAYHLPRAGHVILAVYNLTGQRVAVLVNGYKRAGNHTMVWNASDLSSGFYFYRIEAGDYVETRKCVILK
jgi:predicted outer membrane repeat protein